MTIPHRQVGLIAHRLGVVTDPRFLSGFENQGNLRAKFTKKILCNMIVKAKQRSLTDAAAIAETASSGTATAETPTAGTATAEPAAAGTATAAAGTAAAGTATAETATAATGAASAKTATAETGASSDFDIDSALRKCGRMVANVKDMFKNKAFGEALKIAEEHFGRTKNHNSIPHPLSTKSKKLKKTSRKVYELVCELESCDGESESLASHVDTFTREQEASYTEIRGAIAGFVAQLNDCGIKLYRERQDSWYKRAEGNWNDEFFGDDDLMHLLHPNSMAFREKRVRPDWLIKITTKSGKIFIVILELDEHR